MIAKEELTMKNSGAVKCFEYAWGRPPKDEDDLKENYDDTPSQVIASILGCIYGMAGDRDNVFAEISKEELPFVFQTGYWTYEKNHYTGRKELKPNEEAIKIQTNFRINELVNLGYIQKVGAPDDDAIMVAVSLKGLLFLEKSDTYVFDRDDEDDQ